MRPALRAAVAAAAAAAVLGIGCGGEGDENLAAGAGGNPNVGATISFADCENWNDASVEERLGTVRDLTDFSGGDVPGTGGRGPVLDEEEAYDLFESWCKRPYARAFKLYKLYTRAAGFSGQ